MGWLYKIIAAILALFSTFGINLAGGENYKTYAVNYGTGEKQVMDIFVPESAEKRDFNGVILNVHGGSWIEGTRKARPSEVRKLAGKGYIIASMDYTVYTPSNGATAFTMVDEIQMAIEKIKEFSDKNSLNITKLALTGYSAGAHLAMLYAYTRAEESPIELVFLSERVGPSDFHTDTWGSGAYSLASMLAGNEITDEMIADGSAEEIIKSVSPAMNINEDSVPTLAGYGGADVVVSKGNAEATRKALEKSGIDYTFIMYPNSGHMLSSNPNTAKEFEKAQDKYLLKYFGY